MLKINAIKLTEIMETENINNDQKGKRSFESCADAFNSARQDATDKAKEAAPKIKGAIADAVFDMAYGAAYGTFFASAFANEFIPQTVKDGVAKGAAAGRAAADKVRARDARKAESQEGEVTIELPAPT